MGSNITITSKGQMTIPKDLREQLNVKPGDKCYAWVRNGEMVIVPRNKSIKDLPKVLGKPPIDVDLDQLNIREAIIDAATERLKTATERNDS